jgi:1-acyl-sn-glycerol-3-phosphate acyltransferase
VKLELRSAAYWTLSVLHFFPFCTFLVVLAMIVSPRRWDPLLRFFTRNIVRCSGARLVVRRMPGFAADRTTVFTSNHVNLFDPFVIYSSIPHYARGLELESHFDIPVYGWMMSRFGNVPVPERRTAGGLRRMRKLAREAMENGTSLMTFPEGTRTRTGRVGPFHPGAFRLACELGVPITPVTIEGSYEHHPVGDWRLRPATIVVTLHGAIETRDIPTKDARKLAERVRAIVVGETETSAGPVS